MSFPSSLLEDVANRYVEEGRRKIQEYNIDQWYNTFHKRFVRDFRILSKCGRCGTHRLKKYRIRASHFLIPLEPFPAWFRDNQIPEIKWFVDSGIRGTQAYILPVGKKKNK